MYEPIFSGPKEAIEEVTAQIKDAENNIPGLIFNYPPISTWGARGKRDLTARQLWLDSYRYTNNLYVHIPFCQQKCSYCYYSVISRADDELVDRYIDCLAQEMRMYFDDCLVDRPLSTVFIGGGTPSYMSPRQIARVFDEVVTKCDISRCKEITFECAPESITSEKLAVLKDYGVTRVSMGVQSFDDKVLSKTRRASDVLTVLDQYEKIANCGIDKINIDLIAGVEDEALESMKTTMRVLGQLAPLPSQVTLFTLSVRRGALNHKYMGADPVSIFKKSLENYQYAREQLLGHGYWQYSRNLFPREDNIFQYQDNIWGNNGYVVALGSSGYSHSEGYVYQNIFNAKQYMRAVEAGELPVEKIQKLKGDEGMRRHMVLAMKHKDFDKDQFARFYPEKSNPLLPFDVILKAYEEAGIVSVSGSQLSYSPDAVAIADKYARMFFSDEVNKALETLNFEAKQSADAFAYIV